MDLLFIKKLRRHWTSHLLIPFQDESLVELAVTVLGESGLLYALVAKGGKIALGSELCVLPAVSPLGSIQESPSAGGLSLVQWVTGACFRK